MRVRIKILILIAELKLDRYLEGVLPSEMPGVWPIEALKAQVVASRSYTLNLMEEMKGSHFHLESTIHDQVYELYNYSGINQNIQRKIRQAIRETRDQRLLGRQGKNLFSLLSF